MTLFAAALTVLVMVGTGLVLFRRLARLLFAGEASLPERDLLLLGVLPGLALVGTLATWLGAVHLLRVWIVVPLVVGISWFFREDVRGIFAGLRDVVSAAGRSAKKGDIFPVLAWVMGFAVLLLAVRLSQLPGENVDVWVYHIPLAQSIAAHAGYVYPQISNLFYASQPLFFETLFGTGMLAVDNYVVADDVNIAIFFGVLLLLLSFARHMRGPQFLLICGVFVWYRPFLLDAAQPMIDMPRSCFSVAACLFAYRYASGFRRFDLAMAALLAGAAVAGKCTELVTPLLICVTLAPLTSVRKTWAHAVPAALIFFAVAGFWYLKNVLLYGNPVYPFLFAHPGLSDQWMTDYMHEMRTAFSVEDRIFSTNLLSLQGWRDFAVVLNKYFYYLCCPAIVSVIGLMLPVPRRWVLPLWSAFLFILWYAVMFNSVRWAISATLLLFATSLIIWFWIADRIAVIFSEQIAKRLKIGFDLLPTVASVGAVLLLALGLVRFAYGHGSNVLPRWTTRDLASTLLKLGGVDRYLDKTRRNYTLYRYIGEHDLVHVFQPFDNGGTYYVSAYNGGHSNRWIVDSWDLPSDTEKIGDYLRRQKVRYFVRPDWISPVEIERLGVGHVAMANAVIDRMRPHSKLIFQDGHGVSLYEFSPQTVR